MASNYRLTTKNAHEYVDKYIVGKLFHYWPLKVEQINDGRYVVVDITHTMMFVPDEKDIFNAIYFEKVFSSKFEAEQALEKQIAKKVKSEKKYNRWFH